MSPDKISIDGVDCLCGGGGEGEGEYIVPLYFYDRLVRMTDDLLQEMKELILDRMVALESSLDYLKDESKAVAPSISLGRLTRMDAIGSKAVNEHILSLNRSDLLRMMNALDRIEKGTYGKCLRCGTEIPVGRLQIVPEALMCVHCAEKSARGK